MTITPAMIKELREQTGAGFGDVKSALAEAEGNMEQAVVILRKKGLAAAGKKAGRVTAEGTVAARVDGSTGVLVEVNCETDFVGRNENFRRFADEVAAAVAQSKAGTVEEFLAENWPGTDAPVSQRVAEQIAAIKENISIRRFARYESPENSTIGTYIHGGGKIGVMVEVVAQSGAKSADLDEVAKDIAMHIAAAEPRFPARPASSSSRTSRTTSPPSPST
jgi:elongation factor Ts